MLKDMEDRRENEYEHIFMKLDLNSIYVALGCINILKLDSLLRTNLYNRIN